MPSQALAYATKELSKTTWPDFEKLFSQKNGWDHCQCMHFHRPCSLPRDQWLHSRAERALRNRREKRQLVEKGRAHGILVYANSEPIGWCQYGPGEELPRIDKSRNYQALASRGASVRLWRITCFVVDRKHRKRGVATAALRAENQSEKREAASSKLIPSSTGKASAAPNCVAAATLRPSEICLRTELSPCSKSTVSRS